MAAITPSIFVQGTDFSTPRRGSSSSPCIWRSDTTSSIRNEQSKKSVPSVTSERTFGQNVNEFFFWVFTVFHLDHLVQIDSVT